MKYVVQASSPRTVLYYVDCPGAAVELCAHPPEGPYETMTLRVQVPNYKVSTENHDCDSY